MLLFKVFILRNLKGMSTCDTISGCYVWISLHLKETLTFQRKHKKKQIPRHKCPSYHISIFRMLEKMLSPLPLYRCASQEGTTVWCPSLAPLSLASLPCRGGTEVIKNTASPSVCARCVSGLLSLWRCRLSSFPPYEVIGDKNQNPISACLSTINNPICLRW